MIRVLLVDDHPIVRDGLGAVLELQPDMEVVGEAGDGSGAEATRQILADSPETRVLILTAYDSEEGILEAVRAGASGYLLKGAMRAELMQAIRLVASGGSFLQPALVARLLEHRTPEGTHEQLSEREHAVLKLVVEGLRNKEIADALGIAERTVKFYTGIIFQKLGVTSRTEAAAAALKQGLVK